MNEPELRSDIEKSIQWYEGRIYFGGPQKSDIVLINVHDP